MTYLQLLKRKAGQRCKRNEKDECGENVLARGFAREDTEEALAPKG